MLHLGGREAFYIVVLFIPQFSHGNSAPYLPEVWETELTCGMQNRDHGASI